MTYTPPATQEELDRIIAERLARQEQKIRGEFAGFDEIKAKADKFDKAEDAAKSEIQKALDAKAAAEKERDDLKAAKSAEELKAQQATQVAAWAAEIEKSTHVPANLLRGTTKEELQAHADELKPAIVAQRNPVLPNEGKEPTNTETQAGLRQMLRGMGLGAQ